MRKSEPIPSTEYIGETIDNRGILEEIYSKCEGKGYIIAGVENDIVTVDVGLKSEGRVPLSEFARPGIKPEINVGDSTEVFIENIDNLEKYFTEDGYGVNKNKKLLND